MPKIRSKIGKTGLRTGLATTLVLEPKKVVTVSERELQYMRKYYKQKLEKYISIEGEKKPEQKPEKPKREKRLDPVPEYTEEQEEDDSNYDAGYEGLAWNTVTKQVKQAGHEELNHFEYMESNRTGKPRKAVMDAIEKRRKELK